ncbi:single-stranded-DNA-specific exonuclease RecJ [Marinimicrobium sp. C6131]|uniref:single-stranded-DNA-specific exonuclease RecJ n=1 Tax=Marinimicrobium sp. C6131 TaxID=3022676 RepID=UPI00223E736C|nr:single-stranded-DNA-specific exonuclease RecJ [Marinimicrobium sp. C6131]UZJ45178.1 single-stranded-DNA-specific exonuclease RecJ [Marinimicrobium sp. C6131]
MQKTILRRTAPEQAPDTPLAGDLPPLLDRLYRLRGVSRAEELSHKLQHLHKPTFKGLPEAVALLADAVEAQANVLIVGDFDADGATSSALAVMALQAMGLSSVDFLVPNRFEYGYGLTPEIVEVAAAMAPDVIVTVDNGISSVEGVRAAQAHGIAVVVTDHHLPGDELPPAEAIVNPNQPGCPFPSKNLAGVGVIFYVMNGLRTELRQRGWFAQGQPEPNMANFLDLVALGTVADVVPLDHNNRILVSQGLQRIRAGVARPGIIALLDVAGRQMHRLVASDLGFAIGPRLNAAGRLDDISVGIQCLMCDSDELAREMALTLDELNRDRKAIEGGMQKEAVAMLNRLQLDEENQALPWGLCLYDGNWHQGVIGILASRIKDRLHRPVIVFADAGDGEIKGSARSIPGLHIRDALDAVAARHPHLLNKFGGHAMAAGMTLSRENFDAFQQAFDDEVKRQLQPEDLQPVLISDGNLTPAEVNLELASLLRNAGPWGQHFPEPLFDGEFALAQQRLVGEKHLKMTLALDSQGQHLVDAIAFNIDPELWPNPSVQRVRLAYRLDVNEFRGRQSVQLMVEYLEPA